MKEEVGKIKKPCIRKIFKEEIDGAVKEVSDILMSYYSTQMADGENICKAIYPQKTIKKMIIEHDTRVIYIGDKPVATFTLCRKPIGETENWWDMKDATYIEGVGFLADELPENFNELLCNTLESKILPKDNYSPIMRVTVIGGLAGFYKECGFDLIKEEDLGYCKMALLEKRLK